MLREEQIEVPLPRRNDHISHTAAPSERPDKVHKRENSATQLAVSAKFRAQSGAFSGQQVPTVIDVDALPLLGRQRVVQ